MDSTVSMVLVGKKQFLKKDKSDFCYLISYLRPYDKEETESGCVGYAIGENFVNKSVYDSIGSSDINREFVFQYGMGRYGKPEICGVIIDKA